MGVTRRSILPPRVLAKIKYLPGSDRREYCQHLIGSYEGKMRELRRVMFQQELKYAEGQYDHFQACVDELTDLRDM